jgi:hypothetical protein
VVPSHEVTILLSAIGFILRLAYRLYRHWWLGWPLTRWLGLLLFGLAVWSLFFFWPSLWPAIVLAVLFLARLAIQFWAGRQGYLHFEPLPGELDRLRGLDPPPGLGVQEMVSVRVSGWFTVEGKDQYYVDVEADFETVGTREHIVLGRVHPSRFLFLGRWPRFEIGWWYIFFQPAMIYDLALGHLYAGPQPQLALRVSYAPDAETQQVIYLVFADRQALRRVWDDLLLDAPPGVAP